ncbi:hypothetical protein EPUS_04239 [Endocarpon pusillum Z07020]|uniref:Uncharacterized protein n=1 Tax=Endocarpon pusillum (strain Z07020 / HMAS-L-300199) TaxID=1263415 RepID=U1HU41_ENDPU|nr:uncharacterized protein EPUS_04239 [Endocarpon pusillum Z07020]ERF72804.1 hypothetical protein EPUS_04239 [Endocarpon pusillum Z07020]
MSSSPEQKPGNNMATPRQRKMLQGKKPELWLTTPKGEQRELLLTTPQGEQSELPRRKQQSELDLFNTLQLLCFVSLLTCAVSIPLVFFSFGGWNHALAAGLALAIETGIIIRVYGILADRWA